MPAHSQVGRYASGTDFSYERVTQSIDESLERLGNDDTIITSSVCATSDSLYDA